MAGLEHELHEVGHELDEIIAIRVFDQACPPLLMHHPGHISLIEEGVWFCLPDYYQGDLCLWEPLHFSKLMVHAWTLVEQMESMGYFPMLEKGRYREEKELWCAAFKNDAKGRGSVLACADTPAHALCLAALQVVKRK